MKKCMGSIAISIAMFLAIHAEQAPAGEDTKISFTNFAINAHLGKDKKEEITLRVPETPGSDNFIDRKATLLIRPNAKANILISHGFMCNRYDVSFLRLIFSEYNVLIFDFRAHGDNTENQYSTLGCYESLDVTTAARYMRNHSALKHLPLIGYGFSMGAVASIKAQSEDSSLFDAMILDCPFDSTDKLLERALHGLRLNLFGYEMSFPTATLKNYVYTPYVQSTVKHLLKAIAKMDATQVNTTFFPVHPIEYIKKITVPIFIISCVNDEKVPVKVILKIYRAAGSEYKYLWITLGDNHFASVFRNPELYGYNINNFIHAFLSDALKNRPHKREIIFDDPEWALAIKQQQPIALPAGK